MFKYFSLSVALLFFAACTTTKPVVVEPKPDMTEIRELDELVVTAKDPNKAPEDIGLPVYRASRTRYHDLIHSQLSVRFDIPNQQLFGQATLTLKPYFYPQAQVILDAKGFDFTEVRLGGPTGKKLRYDYDGRQINIQLGKTYTREQEFDIYLDYIANPTKGPKGGSAAIKSDQGLYFIDPLEVDPSKPTQIWTQGETESNSRWCPTIDNPIERATHELDITIRDDFKTLSNGVFIKSEKNPDGTRTDYWKMDMPQTPYLMMMAIGDFDIVSDTWKGKPVNYYMEPQYKDHARAIFPYTPEMLTFFSDKFGLEYPWQKYDQVVVRDYVSGAMENTTAVIFGEFVNGTTRGLMDVRVNELIVAHEMAHHWFGDYVTCESWANTTLNEGFANYSEYLWLENKHGRDEADHHLLTELKSYIDQGNYHPLIHFGYEDKDDMFDAHSYNKGGCTLHMLRHEIGDDAFFASLAHYLRKNAFSAVEVDELRMAVEETTGMDFNWFFDQWYLQEGHPELVVQHEYNPTSSEITVTIEQTQKGDGTPEVFRLPLSVDVYDNNGTATRHSITMNKRKQSFVLAVQKAPSIVELDPEGILLGTIEYDRSIQEWKELYFLQPTYRSRKTGLNHVMEDIMHGKQHDSFLKACISDPFWDIRNTAIYFLQHREMDAATIAKIASIAEQDAHSTVRATALNFLVLKSDKKYLPLFNKVLNSTTTSYDEVGAALKGVVELSPDDAAPNIKALESIDNVKIITALSDIYVKNPSTNQLPFFEKHYKTIVGYEAATFYLNYIGMIIQLTPDKLGEVASKMKDISTDMSQAPDRRFAGMNAISELKRNLDLRGEPNPLSATLASYVQEIKEKESLKELQNLYKQMF